LRVLSFYIGLLALVAAPAAALAEGEPVDVQLVLAVDSSSSVDMDEYYLQLEGYAGAFRHPDLVRAVQSGPHKAIAVTLFEWSGPDQQVVNLPWRILRDEESLNAFADELAAAPRLVVGGETAIGAAIDFAIGLFATSGAIDGRRVIDISGDGISNRGRDVTAARNDAVFLGITVNGMAILNEEPALAAYYQAFVIGGTGAFVMSARDYVDFKDVIVKKLVREITTIVDGRDPRTSALLALNRHEPRGAAPRGGHRPQPPARAPCDFRDVPCRRGG